jgi:hypothetical protein
VVEEMMWKRKKNKNKKKKRGCWRNVEGQKQRDKRRGKNRSLIRYLGKVPGVDSSNSDVGWFSPVT